jgi:ribosomal protein S28E/S33
VTFQEGEEELKRAVVAVLSKTGHGGAVTGHVVFARELTANGAAQVAGLDGEGEEELKRAVVAVLSKTGHGGAVTGHVVFARELTANRVGLCVRRRVLCTPHMNSS